MGKVLGLFSRNSVFDTWLSIRAGYYQDNWRCLSYALWKWVYVDTHLEEGGARETYRGGGSWAGPEGWSCFMQTVVFLCSKCWEDSVKFSSVAQLSDFVTPWTAACQASLPVHHQLPEFTQTYVHWVGDNIQPSHPLSSPSSTFSLSQHQGLFWWVSSSHQVAKVLGFQLQHQSFQWTPRTALL